MPLGWLKIVVSRHRIKAILVNSRDGGNSIASGKVRLFAFKGSQADA